MSHESIARCPKDPENPFAQINRELLRLPEKKLSLEGRGLLCYFLSFDKSWIFHPTKIKKELGTCNDRFYRIIDELREKGYMWREDYTEGNLKRHRYFFSEYIQQEYKKFFNEQEAEKEELKKSFRRPEIQDAEARNTETQDSKYTNQRKPTEEQQATAPSSSSIEDIRRHRCTVHSDACETMPFYVRKNSEESQEKEKFLLATKIPMRQDTLEFLAERYSLADLKDSLKKMQNLKGKIRVPIAVYRDLLNQKLVGVPGTKSETNEEFFKRFIIENEINHLQCNGVYVKNLETDNEISLEIDTKTFKDEILKWMI